MIKRRSQIETNLLISIFKTANMSVMAQWKKIPYIYKRQLAIKVIFQLNALCMGVIVWTKLRTSAKRTAETGIGKYLRKLLSFFRQIMAQ